MSRNKFDPNFTPRSKFERWVRSNGGTDKVSARLGVSQAALQSWLAGRRTPRPHHITAILQAAKGKLKIEDVFLWTLKN